MKLPRELAYDFIRGVYVCDVDGSIWKQAFPLIYELSSVLDFNRDKIHLLWTVNGGNIRRKLADDLLLLKVLKNTLPKYEGDGLVLYRGECKFLYEQKKIGFCWTPIRDVAEKFASGLNSIESGGVLLKAYGPKESVLSSPHRHSSDRLIEVEYTCDPTKLINIEVLQYFEKFKA